MLAMAILFSEIARLQVISFRRMAFYMLPCFGICFFVHILVCGYNMLTYNGEEGAGHTFISLVMADSLF